MYAIIGRASLYTTNEGKLMDMTEDRKHELLIQFTGFISALPNIQKNPIMDEVKEVLDAMHLSHEVVNPN